jgi:glycosyltransferase involved in cell wall biosynthesis
MKQNPLISIVIPCYNYASYLSEAIQSGLDQTYQPIEVIVVDDGSTDDTAKVAKSFAPKVRYHYQDNAGPSAARNTGAGLAKGNYIVFLDADDVLKPEYVAECLAHLGKHPQARYVYTQMVLFGRQSETTTYPEYDVASMRWGNYIHASALLPRELVIAYPYDPAMRDGWEDWDFYLTLADQGIAGVLLNKPLLRYRKHATGGSREDSIQGKKRRKMLMTMIDRHPGLYPAGAKLYVFAKLWLQAHLPGLVPGLKRVLRGTK